MAYFQYFTIESLKKFRVKIQKGLKISRSPKANRAVPGTTNTPYVVKKWKKLPNTTGALCLCYQMRRCHKKRDKIPKNDLRFGQNTDGILVKISRVLSATCLKNYPTYL